MGAVPYLNGRPLIGLLTERAQEWGIELSEAAPSQLVEQLRRSELEAALISSVECLADASLCIVPGIAIVSRGPAVSVRLFSRWPLTQVHRVALDSSSRSSSALARIILRERFGVEAEFVEAAPDLGEMLRSADAAMLIGDAGLTVQADGLSMIDLGEHWHQMTGLPFVFAVWAARGGNELGDLPRHLAEAKRHGLARLREIAESEALRLHTTVRICYDYLATTMSYDLGEPELQGLRRFQALLLKHGLIQDDQGLRFYRQPSA